MWIYISSYVGQFISLILKPEYLALLISVIAIISSVYIAYKNRSDAFSKEEYFKLQHVAERIITKLIIMDNDLGKLVILFKSAYKADMLGAKLLDYNKTFDKSEFEKEGGEIAAFIEIYFPQVKKDWNMCQDLMGQILTLIFSVDFDRKQQKEIQWGEKIKGFEALLEKFGSLPKEISSTIQKELLNYKKKHF